MENSGITKCVFQPKWVLKVKNSVFCWLKFCQTMIIWGWFTGLVVQQSCWSEDPVPGKVHFHPSSNSLSRGYITVLEAATKSQDSCPPGECLPRGLWIWIPLPLSSGPLTLAFLPLLLPVSNRDNTLWLRLGAEAPLLGGRSFKGHEDCKTWLKILSYTWENECFHLRNKIGSGSWLGCSFRGKDCRKGWTWDEKSWLSPGNLLLLVE